ncbi:MULTISPECIES: hypothetical protein [Nitrosomonas]|uniref:DUF4398 domain-containing protein n=1 Tax=Nitrosomonas communis TaxID=44574 RepID=A0A0F7KBC8_9PROT|nr:MULTISPECIES: hypothetical protein [Nitrosomonas]AKH36866.1 hypothetical protein AAW31_02105 [Nitrosomonas communis]TYP69217.1 hypothetical protein BCL69_11552 [Nitrosomonas communis]UVS61968.1 hypothetical protein NX761_02215 [Nitrosomonas sp. PLL12]
MRKNIFCVAVLAIGFLSGCAQMSPIASTLSDGEIVANRLFIDPNNHDAVAKHYEDVAKEMKAKLQAKKEQLEEYERHNYYYGRKGQSFRSHTWANMRYLEKSIEENLKEAAIHHKIAQDQQKRDLSLRTE